MTTSMGRLFNVEASLSNHCQRIRFEGQAAMALEFALEGLATDAAYHFALVDSPSPAILDWVQSIFPS